MPGLDHVEHADGVDRRVESSGGIDRFVGFGDARRGLGGFLRARRERVAPEHVGLAAGRRRRVRGLRREELAQLAGISVDYYVRLEQGRANQPSPEILDALARALDLDAAARQHLATLAGAKRGPAPRAEASPLLRRILDDLAHSPAVAMNDRLDVVAWNVLGAELLGGLAEPGRRDPNQARYLFLDPAARELFPEWEDRATEAAGQLRVATGRYPDDVQLTALVTELSARSADFLRIWAAGGVTMCTAGRKRLRHPVVGPLTLEYATMQVPAGPGVTGLTLHVFSAEEGSPEADALARLAATVMAEAQPRR
jgi:transcriptional regulator with XRE-family HTH domain